MMLGRRAEKAEKRFRSVTKLLIEKLKEAIIGGKLAPGERLSESSLATSLKVGTVALREAFRNLEAQGFVTFRPPDEVVVSKPTREEIEDAYTIAGALEGLAARLGVERAQPEEIEHLRELHQAIKDAANKRDLIRYFDANSNFHRKYHVKLPD